ncbi:MAG: phospho-N-acetylmuramoyl-pentapeptide-transferase [Chloroflexota bacterium]|nr:phospho-N-acetylmuramoyl-pentapeptide-transferase [Chloroflexota bacterium]
MVTAESAARSGPAGERAASRMPEADPRSAVPWAAFLLTFVLLLLTANFLARLQPMALSLSFGVFSCLLALFAGFPFVRLLKQRGLGKKVRVEGPSSHIETKTGTPTMGGLLICGIVLVVTAVLTFTAYRTEGRSILLPLFVLVGCALLGAVDDRMTIQGIGSTGMSVRFKLLWQFAIATVAAVALWHPQLLGVDFLYVPTIREQIHTPAWFFIPLAVVAIVGSANAVNLTDGLDSLAGWTAFVAFSAVGVIAYLYQQHYLVTFCFTVAGAVMAFLWFNAHPAQVFMGDTGSLALGATLAVVALMVGQVLLVPIIGIVFVAEALSVLLQTFYFKYTRRRYGVGRRLFRMSPLHHHFELGGWSETHVTQRFWIVSVIFAMLGVALALI